jgi:ABC-type transport system involved in multi-copper enzyme maturation permease subunit
MKILALMRKEMREILPWVILAVIVFTLVGAFVMKSEMNHPRAHFYLDQIKAGEAVSPYRMFNHSVLTVNGAWLFMISLAMGIALAVRQFWIPFFTKTWQFELHRSVSRSTILFAKMLTAAIGFCIPVGGIWIAMYMFACRPGVFPIPPSLRNFTEGWVFIGLGLLVYLAVSLAALTRAKFYTTKTFGPLFATFIIAMTINQTSIYWGFGVLAVGILMLLSQVAYTFLNREF